MNSIKQLMFLYNAEAFHDVSKQDTDLVAALMCGDFGKLRLEIRDEDCTLVGLYDNRGTSEVF